MAFNGSGTYNLVYTWATEALTPPIPISKLDEQDQDIATALSNCLTRDGQSLPTADIPLNGKRLTDVGDPTTGTDALNRQTGDSRYVPTGSPATINSALTLTSGLFLNTVQRITINDGLQGTDGKNWRLQMAAGGFQIGVLNDILVNGSFAPAISIARSGLTIGAVDITATALRFNTHTLWHDGNDGSGSGLDADLLDGQDSAFYRNAGSINAGTFQDARVPQTSVTQYQAAMTTRNITGKTGIAKTLSTSAPSGGADGDIWYQY
jgi:hypothetical protein